VLVQEGGAGIWVTRKPVHMVATQRGPLASVLMVPSLPAFNFLRWRAPAGGGSPQWLYAIFGYLLPGYRVMIRIEPLGSITQVVQRGEPFYL